MAENENLHGSEVSLCVQKKASNPCKVLEDMSSSVHLKVECQTTPEDPTLLFDQRLKPKKWPRGVFDLFVSEILTPLGFPLEFDVDYDANIDDGSLTVSSSSKRLLFLYPFTRKSSIVWVLPTGEELVVHGVARD